MSESQETPKQTELEKQETPKQVELEKLIDWGFETIISWSVVWLTCFIGLIELLPEMKLYEANGALLTISLCLVYGFLVLGLGYSSHRIGTLYVEIRRLQNSLPKRMEREIGRAPHIRFVMDKKDRPRKWVMIPLAIAVSILWMLILFFKLFL